MNRAWRNNEKTYTACPILTDDCARAYLADGVTPADVNYLDVPPNKIIRNRGVWLTTSYRAHDEATMFLVSADMYEMNVDPLEAVRSQIYCYFSEKTGIHYIGRLNLAEQREGAPAALLPLLEGLHAPIPLAAMDCSGRVVAAA